jgi:membrane protease YdiL (CAAX protease family)
MTLFDHLFAFVLVLVAPVYTAWDMPRLARQIAADPVNARTKGYIWGIASQWGLTLVLIGAWWWIGRSPREMGLRLPDTTSAWSWSLLIAVGGIAFLGQQVFSVLRSADAQAKIREQLEAQPGVRTILPSTPRESRLFVAVSITAGICEEVLYRGYLLWYWLLLVPRGVAIAAAILAFGVGHAYQGVKGILTAGVAGAVYMAVYLLTGSLLAPIVLHAALDIVHGVIISRAVSAGWRLPGEDATA